MLKKSLLVNGVTRTVLAEPDASLAHVLREQLLLTSVKIGCESGHCGACNVILDGKLVRSCSYLFKRLENGAAITTVEGIGTPTNLHPIQLAWILHGGAQCGFCTPGFIVSSKALLDANPDPSREDIRDWFQKHRNACRCTGYKQLVDAVMDAAKVLRGEMSRDELIYMLPPDGRVWGTRIPKPTSVARVTGIMDYGADLILKMPPDTLHLALVQAKEPHANILGIDTSEAEAMPGVFKVLTHADVPGKNRITGLITFPTNKGDGWDRPILCDTKVFQYGDALAIVCAGTEAQARAAAEKVKVKLETLPAYLSAPEAMADDALEIHPGTPNIYFEQPVAKGDDTAPIFKKADVVVEDEFYTQRQPHMPLEPDVGFAYFDDQKRLVVHSKSVGLHLHHAMVAPGIGIEPENLILVQNPTGGGFGYKFNPTMEALLGVAALATGRPVALRYNFWQQQVYTGKRSPWFTRLRYAADKEGRLLAMESDWIVDHGPYSEFGDLLTLRGAQFIGAGYDIPSIRGMGRAVCTNHSWGAAFRGFGAPEGGFASEVLMDELADKLGMDPLELRYRNVYRQGSTTPTGCPPEVYSLPEMIDTLRPRYEAACEKAAADSTDAVKRGVGVSIGIICAGLDGPDTGAADVELNSDNTVTIYATWHDHGQAPDSGAVGTAHETLRPLGLRPEDIRLYLNDMANCPNGGPSGGSRSQIIIGGAIVDACVKLMDAMRKEDSGYRTHTEMIEAGIPTRHSGSFSVSAGAGDANAQGQPFGYYMYGLFMAEVAVELATGATTVERMTLVADVGTVGNRLVVDGQMYGGMAQGVGMALSEDFEDVVKHSTMPGAGFPYIRQIPDDMEVLYVETPRERSPYGASGMGELPLTTPHAAIINAMSRACGARITHLPARPDKVLAALKKG